MSLCSSKVCYFQLSSWICFNIGACDNFMFTWDCPLKISIRFCDALLRLTVFNRLPQFSLQLIHRPLHKFVSTHSWDAQSRKRWNWFIPTNQEWVACMHSGNGQPDHKRTIELRWSRLPWLLQTKFPVCTEFAKWIWVALERNLEQVTAIYRSPVDQILLPPPSTHCTWNMLELYHMGMNFSVSWIRWFFLMFSEWILSTLWPLYKNHGGYHSCIT